MSKINLSKFKIIIYASVFLIAAGLSYFFMGGRSPAVVGDAVEVDWKMLGELDYVSGKASPELERLNGQDVKIPGFMVPLEDDSKNVSEFLLVPTPQACIHVPPPPPNQMVLVEMVGSEKAEPIFGPIWIYGKLLLTPKTHQYGTSSFSMEGVHIEPYK